MHEHFILMRLQYANVKVLMMLLSRPEPWKSTISSGTLMYCKAMGASSLYCPFYIGVLKSSCETLMFFITSNQCWKQALQVETHIHSLQLCGGTSTFLAAACLFIKKWQKSTPDLIFKVLWLDKNYARYKGPSTNNGLEATNSVIKKENTLRERLPDGQLVNSIDDLVSSSFDCRTTILHNFQQVKEISSSSVSLSLLNKVWKRNVVRWIRKIQLWHVDCCCTLRLYFFSTCYLLKEQWERIICNAAFLSAWDVQICRGIRKYCFASRIFCCDIKCNPNIYNSLVIQNNLLEK